MKPVSKAAEEETLPGLNDRDASVAIHAANERIEFAAKLEADGNYQDAMVALVAANDELAAAPTSVETRAIADKLIPEIDRLDKLAKLNKAPASTSAAAEPKRLSIRSKGYSGYDASGEALPLTDEEVAIAIDYGNALYRNAETEDEDNVTRRIAKRHRLSIKALEGIWGRAISLSDKRVLTQLGK